MVSCTVDYIALSLLLFYLVQQRKSKENITRNVSRHSSSESDSERDVFAAPKITPLKTVQFVITPVLTTRKSSNSGDEMNQSFIQEV